MFSAFINCNIIASILHFIYREMRFEIYVGKSESGNNNEKS